MDAQRARLAISLVDLTNLADDCDAAAVHELCARAVAAGTAAVCVWPDFVAQAAAMMADAPVSVATVVNFPTGDQRPHAVGVITEQALADGADDIDVVLPYRAFRAGELSQARAVLETVRSVTRDHALMKVILETGELVDRDLIEQAARFAVDLGADFIKTSTGKTPVSATPEAAEVMLQVIAASDRPVGLKPSGGIRTAADAEVYLALAESVMGRGWPTASTFRFGASGVLQALLEVAGGADRSGEAAADGSGTHDAPY